MYQNRHKTLKFNGIPNMSFERAFHSVVLICLGAIFMLVASQAQAAVISPTQTAKAPSYILKTSLADMAKRDTAILDWRTQEFELTFNLPASDWYESLDLFLSAYPQSQVRRATPLLISLNGAKPVPIYGRASRFDAHIRMDTSRIRLSGNRIKISYQTPRNAGCLTPGDGQWVLDLSRSKLVAKARAKARTMQISEIEQRLAHAMTAPKRVGITAKGRHKLAYEALAAQGIAGRMSFVPEYKLDQGLSDMEFIIGTHDDIGSLLHDKSVLSTQGARVVVDTLADTAIDTVGQPKVVLTGETEEQVLELMRAFASHHFPNVRREDMVLHEFYTGAKLAPHRIVKTGKYKLSDIGPLVLAPSWRPEPILMDFNVTNPHGTSGALVLSIISARDMDPKSRLTVKLNGKSIGFTHLDKSAKMVEFPIKSGMLKASDNQLSIEPTIETPAAETSAAETPAAPAAAALLCQPQQHIPTIRLSDASRFQLMSAKPASATDLSRLAASGAPFDRDSVLVLTARSVLDRQATLRLLGYSAQKFGPKWADAEYLSSLPASLSDESEFNKNILIIGPNPMNDPVLLAAAPSGLKLALGKNFSQNLGQNLDDNLDNSEAKTIASTDLFASANADQVFEIAARSVRRSARLRSGGLAALFPSPYANGFMVGVIGSDRPAKFASAMKSLVNDDYWNGLQGSVSRWDKTTILMTQIATPPAALGLSGTAAPVSRTAKFISSTKTWFASLSVHKK